MKQIKKLSIVVVVFILCSNVYAKEISVLFCQNDSTGSETIFRATSEIEGGLLNALFDSGHIVSNEPATIAETSDKNYDTALEFAINGYFGYLIYVELFYDLEGCLNPANPSVTDIEKIEWKLVQVSDNSIVRTKKINDLKKIGSEKESLACSRVGQQIGLEINTIVRNKK